MFYLYRYPSFLKNGILKESVQSDEHFLIGIHVIIVDFSLAKIFLNIET